MKVLLLLVRIILFGVFKMNVTTKGQVTIPQHLREKYKIYPHSEIEFLEDNGKIYIVKLENTKKLKNIFNNFRGIATVKMTTEEIMSLTRG